MGPTNLRSGDHTGLFRLIVLLALVFGIGQLLFYDRAVQHGAGVVAPDPPVQLEVDGVKPFRHGEFLITPLASFDITARVLSKESYRFDDESDLSPLDLALGWGNMSDEAVLEHISISQSGRWYRWRTDNSPIPLREIETHSANMHMVPANKDVAEALDDLVEGEVVSISGYLIQADASSGVKWRSSLSRKDTGAKSCELVWVERVGVL